MHTVQIPALHSDDPLGFLAALGLLELLEAAPGSPVKLSWLGQASPAVLHTKEPLDLDELAELLRTYLPPARPNDPLPLAPGILCGAKDPGAVKNEPLRRHIDDTHRLLRELAALERETGSQNARWLAALANQLSYEMVKSDSNGSSGGAALPVTRLTPLFAVSGQMTLARSWTATVTECHRDTDHLRAALDRWIRIDGYASANLDQRSLGDAHLNPEGTASQRGAPGPTWLALHSLATFRLTTFDGRHAATGWDNPPSKPAALRWPIWTAPLSRRAVSTLMEHPYVRAARPGKHTRDLDNLSVTAIYSAKRTQLTSSQGPLAAAELIWP